MDILQAIIDYLIDQGLATTKDVDIFKDYAPEDPDEIISIFEYNGSGVANYAEMSVRSIQVFVRAQTSAEARTKIWGLYYSMFRENLYITLADQVCLISMRNTPYKVQKDERGRVVFVFNCGITTSIN